MEAQNQPAAIPNREVVDKRHHPRFKLEVKVSITSRTSGLLTGRTMDISESGISALLRIEVPLGEVVDLEFTLPFGHVVIYAMVRQKNAFRYGFEFVGSDAAKKIIQATCRELAVEQSLSGEI